MLEIYTFWRETISRQIETKSELGITFGYRQKAKEIEYEILRKLVVSRETVPTLWNALFFLPYEKGERNCARIESIECSCEYVGVCVVFDSSEANAIDPSTSKL